MDDEPGRVGARGERGHEFAAAGDVHAEPLLDHHPDDGGAWEGLRSENDLSVRPMTTQGVHVLARPGPESTLVDDDGGGAEALGEVVEAASADDDLAVRGEICPLREESDDI
ncbi:hypothetical protein GCM10009646_07800 [Streptomyces aureus]